MKLLRIISLAFGCLAFVLFPFIYFGTDHMNKFYYETGSGIWTTGDILRVCAYISIFTAIPNLFKKDRYAGIAVFLSLAAVGLLYGAGWHAYVHHGV